MPICPAAWRLFFLTQALKMAINVDRGQLWKAKLDPQNKLCLFFTAYGILLGMMNEWDAPPSSIFRV
jgi:hypothetical protein